MAELKGVLETYPLDFVAELDSPGVGLVSSNDNISDYLDRLALCRSCSKLLNTMSEPSYDNLKKQELKNINNLEGTFAIEHKRVLGYHRELQMMKLKSILGGAIISQSSKKLKVDISNPEIVFKIILSKKFYFGRKIIELKKERLESHHGRNRPFFSPISLHPKFARVMINLTRIKTGMKLLDPFCGTGGILIEGSAIGLRTYGSDISLKMVNGSKRNLDFFDLPYETIIKCDIGDIPENFEKVDAIVTDPPYGRSASTSGRELIDLYDRTFKAAAELLNPGSFLVIMLPDEKFVNIGTPYFELKDRYSVYVHKSLTRHICVYQI